MRRQFLLAALVAAGTFISSCEKDNDLVSEIPSLAEDDPSGIPVENWETAPGEEEEAFEPAADASAAFSLSSGPQRIFYKEKFLRKGQMYRVYIRKQHLTPGYKYTCSVTVSDGDQDLYVLGKDSRRNKWRLIRKSTGPFNQEEASYGMHSDLKDWEDRLYFIIKAEEAADCVIQIFKEKKGEDEDCAEIIHEEFKGYEIGPIAPQSKRWSTGPDILDNRPGSPLVIRESGGRYALGFNTLQHYVHFHPGNLQKDIYQFKMDLSFDPFTEFKVSFYSTNPEGGEETVEVRLQENYVDIAEGRQCVESRAPVPNTQKWVSVVITFDPINGEMAVNLDQGRLVVYKEISLKQVGVIGMFPAGVKGGVGTILLDDWMVGPKKCFD